MEERDNSGTLVVRYSYGYSPIYGIGNCVEIYLAATNKTYTLVMDHRGTGHVLLDNNAIEIGRRYYDAFGVILSESGTWPTDLGYQTNWQTIKIGTDWYGLSPTRIYLIKYGIFSQRDPLPSLIKIVSSAHGNAWGIFDRTPLIAALATFFDETPRNVGLYNYVNIQPTSATDPTGLVPWSQLNCPAWELLPASSCPYAGVRQNPYRQEILKKKVSIYDKTDLARGFFDPRGLNADWWTSWLGDFYTADSAQDMVTQLINDFDNRCACIETMRIVAHGSPGMLIFRGGALSQTSIASGLLAKIKPYLCTNASVILDACFACAGGSSFAQSLADLLGATVTGYTGETNALSGSGEVKFYPKSKPRPPSPPYPFPGY